MNWIGEIIGGLRGIVAVLRFDAEAPKRFANTPDGVRRSFVAAAAGLPIYLMVLQASLAAMTPRPGLMRYLPMMLLFYAIEWLIWPNLMVGIARWLGRDRFYCRYVVAYNWFALAQMILMLPYQTAVLSSPDASLSGIALVGLVVTLVFSVYEWFIARHALEIAPRAAFAVVLLNLLAGLVMMQVKSFHMGM